MITAEQARQLQDDIVAMLARDFGYVVGTPPKKTSTTRAKTARKNPKRDKAWAEAALEAECMDVTNAMTGDRNTQLNLSAYNIFQIVWGNPGLLDEQEVRERLFAAAEACGLVADDGADSVWRTIESGAVGAQTQPGYGRWQNWISRRRRHGAPVSDWRARAQASEPALALQRSCERRRQRLERGR